MNKLSSAMKSRVRLNYSSPSEENLIARFVIRTPISVQDEMRLQTRTCIFAVLSLSGDTTKKHGRDSWNADKHASVNQNSV